MRNLVRLGMGVFLVMLLAAAANALTINALDGKISDWGLDLSKDWSNANTWIPTKDGIRYTIEDNVDPQLKASDACPPSDKIYATGVHIQGTTPGTPQVYNEKVIYHNGKPYCPPAPTWYSRA